MLVNEYYLNSEQSDSFKELLSSTVKSSSINALSAQTGVSRTTIRGFITTGNTPTTKKAAEIIRGMHFNCSDAEIIEKYQGTPLESIIKSASKDDYENNYTNLKKNVERYYKDATTSIFMVLGQCAPGFTLEFIRSEYGANGVAIVSKMIDEGVLIKEENYIRTEESGTCSTVSRETMASLCGNLIKHCYDSKNYDHPYKSNYLGFEIRRVDKEHFSQSYQKASEFFREIRSLVRLHEGPDVVFVTLASDTIIKEQLPDILATKGIRQ